jgi:hypothetical protein
MQTCQTCRHCIGDFCRVRINLGDQQPATLIYIKPDDRCELWTPDDFRPVSMSRFEKIDREFMKNFDKYSFCKERYEPQQRERTE